MECINDELILHASNINLTKELVAQKLKVTYLQNMNQNLESQKLECIDDELKLHTKNIKLTKELFGAKLRLKYFENLSQTFNKEIKVLKTQIALKDEFKNSLI